MRFLVTTLAVGMLLGGSPSAKAGFLIVESWESVSLAPGALSGVTPAGWHVSGGGPFCGMYRPAATEFDATSPLAGPANGNNVLVLSANLPFPSFSGTWDRDAGVIQPNTTYTLSAAIGHSNAGNVSNTWSLQLWADTNGNGSFDGGGFDTFIGQEYGTTVTAVNAVAGQWATNTYEFNSSTTLGLVGKHLFVVLSTFGTGSSYYDNVTLSTPDAVAATPLPPTVLLLAAGLVGLPLVRGVRTRRG